MCKCIYQKSQIITTILQDYCIQEVLKIGANGVSLDSTSSLFSISNLGILTHDEISELLATSIIGLAVYPLDLWSKSSVIAAYLSHGLPVLLLDPMSNNYGFFTSDILLNIDRADDILTSRIELKTLSETAFAKYQEMSHSRHAASAFLQASSLSS
jgi:hypothetical protein